MKKLVRRKIIELLDSVMLALGLIREFKNFLDVNLGVKKRLGDDI